jgi:CRP-like cAMP-binding protein
MAAEKPVVAEPEALSIATIALYLMCGLDPLFEDMATPYNGSQGNSADAVFYIQSGKVKVTVVPEQGKEAVIAMLGTNEFFGEACLAGQAQPIATVASTTGGRSAP